ncbi:MAG: hypothetical protein HY607_03765 [Planctomycetes bacterium]|uniref:hypothetical protein n=1 Tax=Candidatus Wunengus californicus TaxID=3367619 RepID=UPI0040272FEB|nr:hypothetical protein [Planctomycetota bacterium]
MSEDGKLQRFVMQLVEVLQPSQEDVLKEVNDLLKAHPKLNKYQLSHKYADKICWLYASEGAATALPGVIPGLGTGVQIAVEGVAITADLAYMLRCMAGMVIGIGHIYERDMSAPFNQEFVRVLGLWCGVLSLSKETAVRISSKIAIAQFKRVPAEIFKKINRRVATTIVTKYGTKRGGIAVGKLVPFGVGVVVGGGFNLATMKGFKKAAINYYKSDDGLLVAEEWVA